MQLQHIAARLYGTPLLINRSKLEDRGEYIIRAENHWGYREEPVFLNVQRMEYCTIL